MNSRNRIKNVQVRHTVAWLHDAVGRIQTFALFLSDYRMFKKQHYTSLSAYLWIIAGLLWCYIIYRAFFITVTQDEAYSYLLVKTDYWRAMVGSANTHWLNTLFMRLFLWLPGADDPWKLRMLSVLCWPVFSFTVIRLMQVFHNRWLGLIFFGATVLNPFLILYFSLGRGYAAGCTFLLLSVWMAERLMKKGSFAPADWTPVFFVGSLGVAANFSFFYFYLALTGVYLWYLVYRKQWQQLFVGSSWKWWIVVAGTFVFSVGLLFFLRAKGDLFHGGKTDLVASLIGSVIAGSVHWGVSAGAIKVLSFFIFLVLMGCCLVATYRYYVSGQLTIAILMTGVCAGIVLLNILLKFLFGTLYLLERTALVVYLPLVMGILFLIDEMRVWERKKVINFLTGVVACLVSSIFLLNFYKSFEVQYLKEWPVQADSKKCMDQLAALGATHVGMSAWQRDIFHNYYSRAFPEKYSFRYGLIGTHALDQHIDAQAAEQYDYLLLDKDYSEGWDWKSEWRLVKVYPVSGVGLYRHPQ